MIIEKVLIKLIKNNFKNHNLNLSYEQIVYPYLGDLERSEIQNFFYKKTWEEVLSEADKIEDNLTFMLPISIAQYIPAFMIYCISNPDEADTLLDSLVWFLLNKNNLTNYKEGDKKRKIFFSYLSLQQKGCIKEYVSYMCDKYPDEYNFSSLQRFPL